MYFINLRLTFFMRYLLILLSFCFIGTANAQNIDKGLIAHYLFNGDVKDNSKNKNNGTMNGGLQFDTDRFGSKCGALNFNGKNGYVNVPNSRSLKSPRNELSIGVWFRLDPGAGAIKWLTVVCKSDVRDELPNSPQFRLQATNQTISINTEFTERYVKDVKFNVWHHYAVVYDGHFVKTYLDGNKFFEFAYSNALVANSMPMDIGRDLPGGLEYFAGSLDELRIYNRALNDQEVTAIFKNQSEKSSPKPCTTPAPPPPSPTTTAPPPPSPAVAPPLVSIQTPSSSPHTAKQQVEDLSAKIENIDNKNQIIFKVNNQETRDFKFNAKRELFTAEVNLESGYNICEIIATNPDGSARDNVMFQFKPKVKPPPPPPPPPPPVVVKNPPVINVTEPATSPFVVMRNRQKIIAQIDYVEDKSGIVFKLNGRVNNSFVFDGGTGRFLSVANLELGNNFFEIIATNKDGTANTSGIINYKTIANPPTVSIERPSANPHTSSNSQQAIRAKIEHVSNKAGIRFLYNAKEVSDFTYNARRGIFEANVQLENGFNIFEIIATNSDGKASDSGRVKYKPSVTPTTTGPPPTVTSPDLGEVKVKREYKLEHKEIELVCYDHDKPDGDIVSVLVNNEVLIDRQEIDIRSRKELRAKLTLELNKEYIIVSKAWNLGTIPPNTMTMEIYGKNNKFLKKVELTSDIGTSEAIKLIYQPTK